MIHKESEGGDGGWEQVNVMSSSLYYVRICRKPCVEATLGNHI